MNTKFYLMLFTLFLSACANAQNKRQASVDLNRSFHGTGDMKGLGFAVEYGKYIRKRLELTGALSSTIHHDEVKVLITQGGTIKDASYRMGTAGVQLNGQVNYTPLCSITNEFKVGVGPVLRYQSSSASGGYGLYYPTGTVFPEPVFTFQQVEDQNMVTVGYLVSLAYAYTFSNSFFIGAKASFQNDSNGDVITQYGLRIGKRF